MITKYGAGDRRQRSRRIRIGIALELCRSRWRAKSPLLVAEVMGKLCLGGIAEEEVILFPVLSVKPSGKWKEHLTPVLRLLLPGSSGHLNRLPPVLFKQQVELA